MQHIMRCACFTRTSSVFGAVAKDISATWWSGSDIRILSRQRSCECQNQRTTSNHNFQCPFESDVRYEKSRKEEANVGFGDTGKVSSIICANVSSIMKTDAMAVRDD